MASTVIGLDLGNHAVKAVVLQGGARGWSVQYVASRAVTDAEVAGIEGETEPRRAERAHAEGVRQAARDLLGGLPTDGATFIAALPTARASAFLAELPFTKDKQIEQTIRGVLEDRVPFDLEEMLIEYHVVDRGVELAEGGEGSRVVAVLAPRRHVARQLEELSLVEVDPRHLTLESHALALLVRDEAPPGPGARAVAVVDIGARTSQVLVVAAGHARLVRSLDHGGDEVEAEVARVLGLERGQACELLRSGFGGGDASIEGLEDAALRAAQPLLSEVHATLAGWEVPGRPEIGRVYLAGGGAHRPELADRLGELLGVPVERLELPRGDVDPHLAPEAGPEHAVAFGLALRGLRPGKAWFPNFRRGEFVYRADVQTARLAVLAAAVVLLVATIGGVAWFGVRHHQLTVERDALEAKILALVKAEVPDAPAAAMRTSSGATAVLMERALEMQRKSDQLAREGGLTALDVLRELSETVPTDIKVDLDELEITDDVIKMRGQTDSFDAVDRFERELKKAADFASAYKHDSARGAGGTTRFAITIPRTAVASAETPSTPPAPGAAPAAPGMPPAAAPPVPPGGAAPPAVPATTPPPAAPPAKGG